MEMCLRQNQSDGVFKHNPRNIWERTSGGCLELETKTKVEVEKGVLILGGKTVPSCCCSENKDKNKNNHLLSTYYLSGAEAPWYKIHNL